MTTETRQVEDVDVRSAVREVFGTVSTGWDQLISRDPAFAAAAIAYLRSAHQADALPPAIRELLLVAHDVSMTTLDAAAVEERMVLALEAGASAADVLEVIQLLTALSTHGLASGLTEILGPGEQPASHQGPYWDTFESHFPGLHGAMADQLPEYFDAYRRLNRAVWRRDGLAPQWKELVFVVANLSTNHLFVPGARLHAANALRYGATPTQVAQAIALTVVPVARSIDVGLPALERALARVASGVSPAK
ncbi:carboxymuconolactone decarboxylase family protein [Micromonospora sp. NPDC049051]|uniref:carboxymuconolactone decarboxylase family protein n=1 Tax=Micromonospora sp. NPDC049051 TaxID=3364264 RepID=UPI00371C2CAC